MKTTKFLSLSAQDFIKGLIMAIGGGVVAIIAPSIQSGEFVFNWTTIWHTAVASALAYLAKNLFSSTPKIVEVDPSKTSIVDKKTKEIIVNANK